MIHKATYFKVLAGLFVIWDTNLDAFSQELKLEGELLQGGMVVGFTAPGAGVKLDGKDVSVSVQGVFVLGFGRDAPEKRVLTVVQSNGLVETRTLKIRKRIYKVQSIEGLPRRKVTPDPMDLRRIRAEKQLIVASRSQTANEPLFLPGFNWPANGRISGVYGSQRILNGQPRRPHLGLDIAAPEGTPIVAPVDGKVALTHPGMFFNGKTIIIDHGLHLSSIFIHLSEIFIRVGDTVKKGQVIGKIGKTGRTTGPHLHWGVRWRDIDLDPKLLVPSK